jgi:hypothetical protein
MLWKVLRWLGLSLPHQPRRKKGEEASVNGWFLFPADVAGFRRLFLRWSALICGRLFLCVLQILISSVKSTGILGAVHVPLWRGFKGEVKADFFVNIKYEIFLELSFRTCQATLDVNMKYKAWRNLLNRTGISSWTDSSSYYLPTGRQVSEWRSGTITASAKAEKTLTEILCLGQSLWSDLFR